MGECVQRTGLITELYEAKANIGSFCDGSRVTGKHARKTSDRETVRNQ